MAYTRQRVNRRITNQVPYNYVPLQENGAEDDNNSIAPPSLRRKRLSVVKNDLRQALEKLDTTLNALPRDTPNSEALYLSGTRVYDEVRKQQRQKQSGISESTLIKIINVTAKIVVGYENHDGGMKGYNKEFSRYHNLSSDIRHFPLGKILVGAMLALIGTAIIVMSGIIAVASFGLLAPFSVLGIVFGASTVVGGVACGVGALGMGSVMASGMTFFSAVKKTPLRSEMKQLEVSAKANYDIR
jgi:hypothetical protein